MKWTEQYDRLIESLEREVPRGSYNLESVPRIVDDIRDELRDIMQKFNGFTAEKYREYFMRLSIVEQRAKLGRYPQIQLDEDFSPSLSDTVVV